jgi:hypothetical protein
MLVYDISTSKYYRCTGTSGTWVVENFGANSGSVTSVGLTAPAGFDVQGSPVTGSGVLGLTTTLTGMIKGTGSGFSAAIANSDYSAPGHTHAAGDITNVASNRLLGRYSASTGAAQAITVSTGLSLNSTTGVLTATGSGGTVTQISTSGPISGGPITGTGTISHAASGVTAGTYGSAMTVPAITVNDTGHITNVLSAAISGFLETDGGGTVDGFLVTTGDVTVGGNLTVNGTTTTINSTTLSVDDKDIVLGDVATPSDTTALNGGITLKGGAGGDKTIRWAAGDWDLSENCDLASGKVYKINGTQVLSGTALGSGVTSSSLTTLGVVTAGTWNADTISVARGGTGVATLTGLVKANGTNAFSAAVVDEDYLSPNSTIDGGGY